MDRFLEEQEIELNQIMAPQSSDSKIEISEDDHGKTNVGLFNTGKTTIMSPSRQFDRNLGKSGEGPAKRLHHHHHGEMNGSHNADNPTDHLVPKKLKLESLQSPLDQNSPKKQKLLDHSQESIAALSQPSLPSSPYKSLIKAERALEQASQPKHIECNPPESSIDNSTNTRNEGFNISEKIQYNELPSLSSNSIRSVGQISTPPTLLGKPLNSVGDSGSELINNKSVT